MNTFRRIRHAILLAVATSTLACGEEANEDVPAENRGVSQKEVVGCCGSGASSPEINGMRLTVWGSMAVPDVDADGSSISLVPYTSAAIALFDGSAWVVRLAGTLSAPSSNGGNPINTSLDVFAYWSGTDVRLELVPQPVSLVWQDGVLVRSTDATRRYLGTVRTNYWGGFSDTQSLRLVWNLYNQVPRSIAITPTGTWYYTSPGSIWRSCANDAFAPVTVIVGYKHPNGFGQGSYVSATTQSMAMVSSGAANWIATGVGIDSSTVNHAKVGDLDLATPTAYGHVSSAYEGSLSTGLHTIRCLETGYGSGQFFYIGTPSSPNFGKTGLVGSVTM